MYIRSKNEHLQAWAAFDDMQRMGLPITLGLCESMLSICAIHGDVVGARTIRTVMEANIILISERHYLYMLDAAGRMLDLGKVNKCTSLSRHVLLHFDNYIYIYIFKHALMKLLIV